jgi:cytidylate kinase
MIIAIDGPSGAGKSTLGKRIAAAFDLTYLDTGAMYRAVGLAVVRAGIAESDHAGIETLTDKLKIELPGSGNDMRVLMNQEDVTSAIRSKDVTHMASVVSTIHGVRNVLVKRQQEIGETARVGAILEGRDIGTVVFPNADFKFFLTADAESRAKRRFKEDLEKGRDSTLEETIREISDRDRRDANREHSPLRKAEGAIEIDASDLNIEEVFEKMSKIIEGG